jgi:hypothetical protein
MAYFQTKNPNLGKFWRTLRWKMFVYFMSIWSIQLPGYFVAIWYILHIVMWYIFSLFGMLYQ